LQFFDPEDVSVQQLDRGKRAIAKALECIRGREVIQFQISVGWA